MIDRLSIIKSTLDLIFPGSKSSTREMNEKLRTVNATKCKGEANEMMQCIEDLHNDALVEGKSYQDTAIDILVSLSTVQDK